MTRTTKDVAFLDLGVDRYEPMPYPLSKVEPFSRRVSMIEFEFGRIGGSIATIEATGDDL